MNSIVSAASLATATVVAGPSLATTPPVTDATSFPGVPAGAPDPIFAAIEAHRCANDDYKKAVEAPSRVVGKHRPARVCVGHSADGEFSRTKTDERGGYTLTWTPNGEKSPIYAHGAGEIRNSVPRNLEDADRDAWIAKHLAELKKEERRIAKQRARTKLGKLEAILARAGQRERDRMWDLIWTTPTTLNGLAALLRYCRENETINEVVFDDEWEDTLEWTIERAVCDFAGLPAPPMSEIVAELYNTYFD
jgi:hypothetical protein